MSRQLSPPFPAPAVIVAVDCLPPSRVSPTLQSLVCLLLALWVSPGVSNVRADNGIQVMIPGRTLVGADCLPGETAPVKAPFPMPGFRKPQFPSLTASIIACGAIEDELATRAIQAAIDAVSSKGGGTVIIPAGKWLTGRVSLKSNVNLRVEEGAEVSFSGQVEDYRPAVFTRNEGVEVMSLGALIYANGQTNIAVTGKGRPIGPPSDCSIRKQVMKSSVVENFLSANTPVSERVYEGHDSGPIFLPMFISPIQGNETGDIGFLDCFPEKPWGWATATRP